jgi:hypothetical protein
VLGFHDPCIAVPSLLLTELRPDELDQIILHEYGHVQRRDDWLRLLQTLLEGAMWLHPAVWLIGRALNLEREVACDDWVIGRTGSPRNYARCLSRAAQRPRATAAPAFAEAWFGVRRHLVTRVDRLLDNRRNTRRAPSLPAAVLGGAAIALCAVQLRTFPTITDAPMMSGLRRTVSATSVSPKAEGSGEDTVRRKPDAASHPLVRGGRRRADTHGLQVNSRSRQADQADVHADHDVLANAVEIPAASTEAAPVLYPTRVFVGTYERADNSMPTTKPKTKPTTKEDRRAFNGVVTAGLGIGEAAHKAGLGLSDAFTRAGTGLARRF